MAIGTLIKSKVLGISGIAHIAAGNVQGEAVDDRTTEKLLT